MTKMQDTSLFAAFFKQHGAPIARGKFLSRILGIFSEEIVRIWADDERAPYRDLGRPTLKKTADERGSTLDFTFQDRLTNDIFVAEMKCEIEFGQYHYLTLMDPRQLDHHTKPAFGHFKQIAREPGSYYVIVNHKPIEVSGAILIWGDVTGLGRMTVIDAYGFKNVIGLNNIISDLWSWRSQAFLNFIQARNDWSDELFKFLTGEQHRMTHVFKNDDTGFYAWRDSRPNGYICNIPYPKKSDEREYYIKHICLHNAGCSCVSANKNGEQAWTTKQYFKICSDDISSVDAWIRSHANLPDHWELRRCRICAP